MKYTKGKNTWYIPDNEIDKAVDKLDCSIAEACEMYLADHDLTKDETVEELTKKATKNKITSKIHGAKGEKKPRKPKEKKENALKKEIIQVIYDSLTEYFLENGTISIKNDEKYIDLTINNRNLTINLVEHRTKKE